MKNEIQKQAIFSKEKYKDQLAYWLRTISGELKPMELPKDFKDEKKTRETGETDLFAFTLPGELCAKAISLSKKSDLSLYVYLLTVFKVFLTKFTRDNDTLIVSPLLKVKEGSESQGKFNQRVLFREPLDTALTFKELLVKTRDSALSAYKNQNYPLDLVFKKNRENIKDYPFLDKIIFSLKNIHHEKEVMDLDFDLLFSFKREGEILLGEIHFNKVLFKRSRIENFYKGYANVLQSCLQQMDARIKDLSVLSREEVQKILSDFSMGPQVESEDKSIQQLVETQAESTPHRVAVVGPVLLPNSGPREKKEYINCHLSFKELNIRANQLAGFLRKKNIGANCIVGLLMEPSVELIIGVLAVMKAGGAYLPIAPTYPAKRLEALLEDSKLTLLISREDWIQEFSFMFLRNLHDLEPELLVTPPRPLVDELDSLQIPDRSYVDYQKYSPFIGQSMIKNSVTFHFSRGCLYKCLYCFKIWPNDRYVHRSAENMFSELHFYYKMGVRKFSFVDDLPNFNIKESAKFYQLIIKNKLKVQMFYPNGLRGDILTKDYIDLMVEAGTISLDVALETTSPRLQKLIGKRLNLERLDDNIQYMISQHPHLILETQLLHGIPTETEEEAKNSMDYLKSLKWVHMPYLHVLKIYPNTDMARLAIKHGISEQAIENSDNQGYNELPETLPFPKSFTHKYQSEFASEYFMLKERLLAVLPHQMKVLSEDELVQKYNSFLPVNFKSFTEILNYVGIQREEIGGSFLADDYGGVPDLNDKIRAGFPVKKADPQALRVLLIDLSAYFSSDRHDVIYDVVEPPLGLMYLQTHLDREFGNKVSGKIVASRIDFDCFQQLREIIEDFKPQLIGIRTINFYKEFFHKTVSLIRQWGTPVPIVVGGPYATSSYRTMLADRNVDIAVLGEGEVTFADLVGKIIQHKGILPNREILEKIPGLAFTAGDSRGLSRPVDREVVLVDQLYKTFAAEPTANPPLYNQPQDLAYIIYTSGSTGTPKGVLVQQNNLVNQVSGLVKKFSFDMNYNYVLLASITFDVSVMHLFLPLISGGKLCLISEQEKRDPMELWRFIHKNTIDVLNIVPAFMKALLENMEKKQIAFKYLFVGGDVFDKELYQSLRETFSIDRVINIYGPTETTINATLHECEDDKMNTIIPIGKPLGNYSAYILDRDLKLAAPGVPGELCISGKGVARGYLNHPEKTGEKFLEDSFLPGNGTMFRTGDLARWSEAGNLEFLGRLDQQVKIRGYRIEPGEIERKILSNPKVKEAVVMARQDPAGEKYLCAYVVPAREKSEIEQKTGDILDEMELKNDLANILPEYMVPSRFIEMDAIPLTSVGKIDIAALPEKRSDLGSDYTAPRNEREEKLAQLWSGVVGMDRSSIGIDANFFSLGGHSLKATILVSKIHKALDVKVPMVELFKTPTIRGLSEFIKNASREAFIALDKVENREYYPLSSAQKRLYILHQIDPNSTAYNMPIIKMLPMEIDRKKLEFTFKEMINRHEVIRTSLHNIHGQPVQEIHSKLDFKIEFFNIEGKGEQVNAHARANTLIKDFIRPFDLSRAPLIRVGIIEVEENNHILIVDMHHIISDHVSLRIFIREFLALYRGETLAPLQFQYKDYAVWQDREKSGPRLKEQENYWGRVFEQLPPPLNFPLDFPRPARQDFSGDLFKFEIGASERTGLNNIALGQDATLFMVLVAIFNVLLYKMAGSEDVVMGTPIEGRSHPDLHHIIGMFVSTLVIRNRPRGDLGFESFLNEVKRSVLEAYENQDYQFEDLVDKLALKRDLARNPLFDMALGYGKLEGTAGSPGPVNKDQDKKETYDMGDKTAKFDLLLNIVDNGSILMASIRYRTKLFKEESMENFAMFYKRIVNQVISDPQRKLSGIELLDEEERQRLIKEKKDSLSLSEKKASPENQADMDVKFNF